MNRDVFQGWWKQARGQAAKAWWGQLTDDELDEIEGESEKLVGVLEVLATAGHVSKLKRRSSGGSSSCLKRRSTGLSSSPGGGAPERRRRRPVSGVRSGESSVTQRAVLGSAGATRWG